MRKTVKIGGKSVEMLCNAVTPILYKNMFNSDILRDLWACEKVVLTDPSLPEDVVAMMSDEQKEEYLTKLTEYEGKQLDLLERMCEAVNRLAFTMNMQAQYADKGEVIQLSGIGMDDYISWLSQFGTMDLTRASKEILGVYHADAKSTSKRKN